MAIVSERTIPKKAVSKRTITTSLAKKIRSINTQDWIYVSPKDNRWTVRKDGTDRAMRVYRQKISALNAAKRIVQISGNRHIIVYNLQGEISKII
jgi:hypothetical protein